MREARPMISVDMMVLVVCVAGIAFIGGMFFGQWLEFEHQQMQCPNAEGKVLLRDANGVCTYQKAGYGKAVWVHYKREGVLK